MSEELNKCSDWKKVNICESCAYCIKFKKQQRDHYDFHCEKGIDIGGMCLNIDDMEYCEAHKEKL